MPNKKILKEAKHGYPREPWQDSYNWLLAHDGDLDRLNSMSKRHVQFFSSRDPARDGAPPPTATYMNEGALGSCLKCVVCPGYAHFSIVSHLWPHAVTKQKRHPGGQHGSLRPEAMGRATRGVTPPAKFSA